MPGSPPGSEKGSGRLNHASRGYPGLMECAHVASHSRAMSIRGRSRPHTHLAWPSPATIRCQKCSRHVEKIKRSTLNTVTCRQIDTRGLTDLGEKGPAVDLVVSAQKQVPQGEGIRATDCLQNPLFVFPLLTGSGQRHQVKALSRVSSKPLVYKLQFPEFRASSATRRSVSGGLLTEPPRWPYPAQRNAAQRAGCFGLPAWRLLEGRTEVPMCSATDSRPVACALICESIVFRSDFLVAPRAILFMQA
ncbi:hypothetical protein B0J15DRAFT_116383 [Fusarium solani]|uniref:Uncharacterized protein n=1 Tax=Fusarium solani TaxID=169388 RepID=A0A9P9L4C4_FUSSL|nr:uncharacterized protein B0J15DRAFT_116383 [Fusarium solani]KAH7273988.1 hypothetical protein B0J15DRAFT_116383 [Fusarium solani]